jgi:quinol monooxygenase YgiN
LTETVQLDFHIVPFRAKRFAEVYRPAVVRALEYGAKGYSFYVHEDDSSHFVHVSYWDERSAFDRYWLSAEMRATKERISGLHDHLLLPHWGAVLERA